MNEATATSLKFLKKKHGAKQSHGLQANGATRAGNAAAGRPSALTTTTAAKKADVPLYSYFNYSA